MPAEPAGGLTLWTAPLDLALPEAAGSTALLSEEELERARRLRFAIDRTRFVAGRLWLRHLLADRLGVDVADIRLQTASRGKPALSSPMATWLRFSMARSGPLGLYGLARNLELGVDLEAVSRDIDVDGVGSRFLAPAERDMLSALRGDEQQRGFYRLWARKEAVLKAIGVGLHSSTAGLDVSGEVARFDPTIPGSAGAAQVWFVHDLHVAPGYAAALACEASLPGGVPELRDVAELFHQAWPDEGAPHP